MDQLQREIGDLRGSRRRLVVADDADRRTLERKLHDGLQQDLVALAAGLQLLAGYVDGDRAAKQLLDELRTTARQALDEAAELAQSIYPPLLEARGLASALRSAAARAGVAVDVDVRAATTYSPETIRALYWCCAESLRAAPLGSRASISVGEVGSTVSFAVETAGAYTDERFERVRDRAEALGGRVTIRETAGGVSLLSGTLPLSA